MHSNFQQYVLTVANVTIRNLDRHFCVAKSFIKKSLKQYKETGDICPQPQGGSPEPKLKSELNFGQKSEMYEWKT